MIEKMHERSQGWAFKIIFAVISLSFVIGGIGMGGGFILSSHYAAKVNGQEISHNAFLNSRNEAQERAHQQLGNLFWNLMENDEYAQAFNTSVIDNLINDELLRQYADDLKLGISAGQIKSAIVNDPMFQQEGKFSNNLYLQTLRNHGVSVDGYAAMVGRSLLTQQMQQGILDTEFSVPAQNELLAKMLLQKREIRVANLSLQEEVDKQTVSVEELTKFYEQNAQNYVHPEQMTVEYVTLGLADVAKNVQVTDEQIQTYYDRNRASYTTKGEQQLAHIQLANEADAQSVLQAVRNGEDFAKLAQEKSQDTLSAKQGGDLGWAKAGTFPTEFEQAAEKLNVGEVSEPVKVNGQFHLIKVLARKNETILPLEQVKARISQIIRDELGASEYATLTNKMANSAFENNGSLAAVAELAGATLQTTDAFTAAEMPEALKDERVQNILFAKDFRQNGQNSEGIEVGDDKAPRTMFIRVSRFEAEKAKTFEEARDEVETAVKFKKAGDVLATKAAQEIENLQAGKPSSVVWGEKQTVGFDGSATNSVIFALDKTQKVYDSVQLNNGDIAIFALDNIIDGSVEDFAKIAPQIQQADRQVLMQMLLNDLRERASIKINDDVVHQRNNF